MGTGVRRNGEVSFWLHSVGLPARRPGLDGSRTADVCILGGGFTGLWTAFYLKRHAPDLDVVVLEREFAGFGASGRNGGQLLAHFAGSRDALARTHGREAVLTLQREMRGTVDEVISVAAQQGIDADIVRHGVIRVARSPAQLARVAAEVQEDHHWGLRPEEALMLDADALAQRLRITRSLGGSFSPLAARVHPAKLVRGLAAAAERLGVSICEGTAATAARPGLVSTDRGDVRAPRIICCLEGFTESLPDRRRRVLPMNSAIIATEPLSEQAWQRIGWEGAEVLGDGAHFYMYAQRTADGRIAFGGRGVPYRFGSRTDHNGRTQQATIRQLVAMLHDLFPAAAAAAIDHAWCGVLGVPRDWQPFIDYDASAGLGFAGGYVGEGVATSNLVGRTLADLVLERDSPLTVLPWVGHSARRWEPEPLRLIGSRLIYGLYRAADRRETRSGSERTDMLARVADLIAGR